MPRVNLMKMPRHLTGLLTSLMMVAVLSGCQPEAPQPESDTAAPQVQLFDTKLERTSNGVWHLASLELKETQQQVLLLQQSIDLLLTSPNDLTLGDAREQWHKTHQTLQQLEPFFSLADINPGLFGQLKDSHFLLDAWPIQAGYLDYFGVYTHSGLVNDITVPMTAEILRNQHGFTDNSDITIGLHAMAYLLWGESGQRPIEDFKASAELSSAQKQSGMSIVDLPSNRRRTLLKLQGNLLLDDLEALQYRMTHSASAVSSNYHQLTPDARLALWQESLQQLLADDLLATQLAPKLANSTDFIEHNWFSGHQAQALQHTIAGVERLLWHRVDEGDLALVAWLVKTEHQPALRQQLQSLQQQLAGLDEQWQQLPADTHAQLLLELEQIIDQLGPTQGR